MNDTWKHPLCDACHHKLSFGQYPVRTGHIPSRCCRCGETTNSGIFMRLDPKHAELTCSGDHPHRLRGVREVRVTGTEVRVHWTDGHVTLALATSKEDALTVARALFGAAQGGWAGPSAEQIASRIRIDGDPEKPS